MLFRSPFRHDERAIVQTILIVRLLLMQNSGFIRPYFTPLMQDSSVCTVCTATGYGLGGCGSLPGRTKEFSLLHSNQTGPGAHTATYPNETGDTAPGLQRSLCEADDSLASSVEVENGGALPPSHTSSWLHALLI